MRSAGLRIQGPSARLHPVHLFTAEGQKTAWGLTIKCVSIHFRKAEKVDNFVDFLLELDYWGFSIMRRAVLPVWHFWMLAWILFPPALTLKKINSYSRKRQASILWLAGFWLWMMYKLLFFLILLCKVCSHLVLSASKIQSKEHFWQYGQSFWTFSWTFFSRTSLLNVRKKQKKTKLFLFILGQQSAVFSAMFVRF